MTDPAPGAEEAPVVPRASLGRPGHALSLIAGLMIAAMMFVTTIDVIGRDLFNLPIYGAFEMTEILMGLVIFAGLPLASAAREHITVNFLESALSPQALRFQAAGTDLICAAVAFVMAWRVGLRGSNLVESGEVTLALSVNRGFVAWAMAALLVVTALVFVYSALVALRGNRRA